MPYRPTPKTVAKKAETRRRLVDAAKKLFVEVGYEETSLQEIVVAAKSSIGACYSYFPHKESILLTIAEEFRERLALAISRATQDIPLGPGLLAASVYLGVRLVLENPNEAMLVMAEAHHPSLRPMAMELFAQRVQTALEHMPELFDFGRAGTPALAASSWHGSTYFILERALRNEFPEDANSIARFLARWNLQALGLSVDEVNLGLLTLDSESLKNVIL